MTKILQAIDNNEYTTGVFLDLAKAFDTVNHALQANSVLELLSRLFSTTPFIQLVPGQSQIWINY